MMSYLWQQKDWPDFTFDEKTIDEVYEEYFYNKAILETTFSLLPDAAQSLFQAESLSSETISSSAIEGEQLPYNTVFSSILRQLDLDYNLKAKDDKYAQSVSKMIIDAVSVKSLPTQERIFAWHHLLFDSASKAKAPKNIGRYRTEPVYVMHWTGRGEEEIVYEAVPADRLQAEMDKLFRYIADSSEKRAIVKSAVAFLWFVSIHPFSDGNGRISRAVSDAILSALEGDVRRYFSMSTKILKDRRDYYDQLQTAQNAGSLNITKWIVWYVNTAIKAMKDATAQCVRKIKTANIMRQLDPSVYNARQLHMLYILADGAFVGNLTQEKWMKMTKCKSATATRDLAALVESNILIRIGGGKRSIHYLLNPNLEYVLQHPSRCLPSGESRV